MQVINNIEYCEALEIVLEKNELDEVEEFENYFMEYEAEAIEINDFSCQLDRIYTDAEEMI